MSYPTDLERELVILKDSQYAGADEFGDVDITKRVTNIEYIDAAPQSCLITLNARDGYFRTRGPEIRHWDRIYVELSDRMGRKTKDVFHVKKIKPVIVKGAGRSMHLVCLHESSNLYTQITSKPNQRVSGVEAFTDIMNQLNTNRMEKDPTVIVPAVPDFANKIGVFLDPTTYNDYIFEMRKVENAIDIIVQKEAQPVETGGSKEFYFFRFKSIYDHDTHTGLGHVSPQMIPQGYRPTRDSQDLTNIGKVTIEKKEIDDAPNSFISLDSNLESEKATNIIVIGNKHSDSIPTNYAQVNAEFQQFLLIRDYDPSLRYRTGARVRFNGQRYEALADIRQQSPPNVLPSQWRQIDFVPSVTPSPLTNPQYFLNFMYGYIHHGDHTKVVGFLDHNCVVQHDRFPRLFVRTRATSSFTLYQKTDMMLEDGYPPHNFTILINGTGTGDFAGSDPNGNEYANSIARYIRPGNNSLGKWYVYRAAVQDLEIIVLREGETWVYNPVTGPNGSSIRAIFDDQSRQLPLGVDNRSTGGWLEGAYDIESIPGFRTIVIWNPINKSGNISLEEHLKGHSIAVHPIDRNEDGSLAMGHASTTDFDDTENGSGVYVETNPQVDRGATCGVNFGFPWPNSRYNSPFGGINNVGEQIKLDAFDFFNMHQNLDEGRSLIGPKIRDFLAIQGIGFTERFQSLAELGILELRELDSIVGQLARQLNQDSDELHQLEGNFKHILFLVDEEYNIVEMEYTHTHNNVATPRVVSVTKYNDFRSVLGTSTFARAQQPEIFNRFNWRRVIYGGIFTSDPYDADGRYLIQAPTIQQGWNRFWLSSKLRMTFDLFRLVKPIIASNIKNILPERNIISEFIEDESITNIITAQHYVESLEPIYAFRREEWILETEARYNIQFGDPLYYKDEVFLKDTVDGRTNSVKCVAESITYMINKPKFGVGGRLRKIHAVTRFWPTDQRTFNPDTEDDN